MIVREDRTFEINLNYPNSNWTGETEGVYVVDETTPEGQALAEKIMMLFPYFDLVIVDGELVDVVENPDLKQEWEEEQEFLEEEDDEIVRITLEELGLDQVDNTRDLDKPISRATQEALDGKVDKVEGKGLSTRDFLPEYEEKLAGIEPGANKYIHPETHPVEMIEGLATVAITGDYNDLINKPDLGDIGGDIELPPDLTEDVLALQNEVARLENELDAHTETRAALNKLGHVYHATLTATLNTSGWTETEAPFTQVQAVSGILATDVPIVDVVLSGDWGVDEARLEAWGYIYRIVTSNDSITAYAREKPDVALPLQLKVVR